MQQWIDTDLDAIIEKLPSEIRQTVAEREDMPELLEVILDLGREPQARFPLETVALGSRNF